MMNLNVWFAALTGVALKSTLVLGIAWLAAILSGRRSAAGRHLIWTAAGGALLVLPFLSISLPSLPFPGVRALPREIQVAFQTTSTGIASGPATPAVAQSSSTADSSQPSAPGLPNWRVWLIILWIAGVARALVQVAMACSEMWKLRRTAMPSDVRHLAGALAGNLGLGSRVEVLEAGEGTMPMAFGILSPRIILPSTAATWSEDRRRVVLLHELAHIRRGDIATHWMMRVALIPLWWNPLAWIAWREFLKESERATDDLVLQAGTRASDYANHLLEVARTMQAAPGLNWAAVAMARRSQLEGRLAAILDGQVNRGAVGRASAFAVALLAIALVAPLAALRGQDTAAPQQMTDIDNTIRAAAAQKNHEMLEKPAELYVSRQQFDTARKLLESAVAIRGEVSGTESVEYGIGLIKLGDLEQRNRRDDASAFYSKALKVLGATREALPALMFLGKSSFAAKDFRQAEDYFTRARNIDPVNSGPPQTWMALIRQREQRPEEAEALFKSALELEGAESGDASTTMELYAFFLKYNGREDESKQMMDRAMATRKQLAQKIFMSGPNVMVIGQGIKAPKLDFKVEPVYSDEARAAKLEGTVLVSVEISAEGLAQNMTVLKGLGLGLDESAIQAIRSWKFSPATQDGSPVAVRANIEVNFRLM